MRRLVAVALLAVAASPRVQAQERYLVLATTRTSTMQQELNDASDRGFRVVGASRTDGAEVLVVLERASGDFDYHLIATQRTGTLQREITAAAERGYRVVPQAVTTKRNAGLFGLADANDRSEGELLVIMEKGPGTPPGLAYHVVATSRTSTFQKEMSEAVERGYTLVALTSRGEHVAIFERGR
ncbi:MAG: hypothetical protein AB7U83_03200 [Vicinamibacterales bacterium]